MGNNGNTVYIRMEEAHGVLVRTGRYTGLTETARYEDYYGGYYYEDRTEDGMTSSLLLHPFSTNAEFDSAETDSRSAGSESSGVSESEVEP